MSNNKLAEALGLRFCKTCGEEITNVEIYFSEEYDRYIIHDSYGFYTLEKERPENDKSAHWSGHMYTE